MKLFKSYNERISKYFEILEPNFPDWLNEYINTKEMQRLDGISVTCGTYYTDLLKFKFQYSSLAHSVAVALIVWHFSHDKKQTLAGLFHDISTPVFKHAIDFLNGDYEKQESTEELTSKIIKNSTEIMKLLKRDNISLEEVEDYKIYPIADNDTPKLSADRLEYSLSNALLVYNRANIEEIKKIYNDLEVQKNEDGVLEIGFKSKEIARDFVDLTSRLSLIYRGNVSRFSMQFLADLVKKLNEEKLIFKEDLYNLSEKDVIEIIKKSKYKEIFNNWVKSKKVLTSKTKPKEKYSVCCSAKVRYIDPLCNGERISKIDKSAKEKIEENFSFDMSNYLYLDTIDDFTK